MKHLTSDNRYSVVSELTRTFYSSVRYLYDETFIGNMQLVGRQTNHWIGKNEKASSKIWFPCNAVPGVGERCPRQHSFTPSPERHGCLRPDVGFDFEKGDYVTAYFNGCAIDTIYGPVSCYLRDIQALNVPTKC